MEDTKTIENPVYDTNGAYLESEEDEVTQQHYHNHDIVV